MNDARLVALEVLHRPHLVLADAGRPDHVLVARRGEVAQRLDHRLRLEHALGLAVPVRELRTPLLELAQPGRAIGSSVCGGGSHLARQLRERELERADDRDLRLADLPDLGRVDVEVDHLRARRERRDLAGDAVVEARADGDRPGRHLFSAQFAYFEPCMPGAP